jgi:hypothetical protein
MNDRHQSKANLLAENLYVKIKDEIFNFRLLPGDRFTETEMAERFGVSRTPIRDALWRRGSCCCWAPARWSRRGSRRRPITTRAPSPRRRARRASCWGRR